MALVYKVHVQGGGDDTVPFPHNHPYIHSGSKNFSYNLQLLCRDGYVGAITSV